MTRLFAALVLVATAAASAIAQAPQHVIQGRVTSDSGVFIAAADVIVTIAPTAETILGKTDATGAYRIAIPTPTGEYILNVSLLGWKPFRQRVTIAAPDTVAVVNPKLSASVQQIAAVRVEARRPRPARALDGNPAPGTDGTNKVIDGVINALPPELRGNIEALAALVPGLAVTSNGVSAFGMGSDANMTTLNGMPFAAGAVPRDLQTGTSFITSTWDPRYGGFSGALQSATLNRGTNIFNKRASAALDAPMLQVGDAIASRFGQKFTNVILGGASSGPFSLDRYFFNTGYQASRRTADVATLLDLDRDALLHAGISPDSAFRLTQLLNGQHVPLTTGGIPDSRTTMSGSFLGRFDKALPATSPAAVPLPAWNIVFGANLSQSKASGLTPTALPATTGTTTDGNVMIQGLYSRYLGKYGDYVNETSTNITLGQTKGSPFLSLPSGNVLIASSLSGAASPATIGSLGFGGSSGLARDSKTLSWELDNMTSFLIKQHPSLPAKLFLQSRYEHYDQSISANRLGSFSYASLADLAANVASSYARTLNVPDRAGGEWNGAASLGGSWNTPKIAVTGGARVDANVFTGLPAANPAIERTFGVRNDGGPNSVDVSPRLGFQWFTKPQTFSVFASPISTSVRGGPQVRGGVGLFRSFLPSTLLSDAIGATGLPGSTQRLICTGPAAPIPDWSAFASNPSSIPVSCAGGTSVFADTAPSASLVDPSYRPSKSWRAALGWTNTIKGNYIAIDGLYSLNLNQAGTVDLNFGGTERFALADEGGRPVFVSPASIVSATGSVSAVESRRSALFGRVNDRVSDLRGDARQITAYVIPNIPFRFGLVTIGYTYADARVQARGFDQGAATDPRSVEWAASPFTPRHQIVLQSGRAFFGGHLGATMFMRAMSGLRFTPTAGGDVNGDGSFNDRAFIFRPETATDTSVARGLRDILATGSSSARACLQRQLGTIAGRNSCVGPWTATMNMSLVFANVPGTNNRLNASLNIANPLGGLDQLLHGMDNLHGWGAAPLIDGTLYQARGFDATARRFLYQVNPRFGNTSPSNTTFRTPFRLTLDVRLDLGHDAQEQALILNLRVKPPLVGTRASADTIKSRYMGAAGSNGFSDIYKLMLRYADSLALTREQTEKVQAQQKVLQARADSVFSILAKYLAALPSDFNAKDALKHVTDASEDVWTIIYAEVPFLKELLTPGQIRLLPEAMRNMVITPNFRGHFYYGF
ncbi:MAG TPA: carboxypeptidase-like regulatory domain-containing protein [Gemmatimonadaceae bacterium]|nr:carboxypeptidase-like regulatory domain-containing protein [Gemmatimonadaceae bacterium]